MAINRGQRASSKVIAAPVGGLNARDALAAMPELDASVMVNVFPFADRVETRSGVTTDSTQSTLSIASTYEGFRRLIRFTGAGTEALFGCFLYYELFGGLARTRIKICAISGGVSTATLDVVPTATSNSLEGLGESTLFTTTAGATYLLLCANYTNSTRTVWTFAPQAYDGSAWTVPAITGLPNITLGTHSHRNRLWFYNTANVGVPGKELSAWYLPVGAIAGAVTEFPLGPFANKGGRIVAMRSWTIDGGDGGSDDLAVFLTDQGQALVYQGTDPASSATWVQVGVFDVGKVASFYSVYNTNATTDPYCRITDDNFAMKYGRDVLIATQNGVVSMNRILNPGGQDKGDFTISAKIRPLLTDAAATWTAAGINCAWNLRYMPLLRQLIVSIPVTEDTNTSGTTFVRTWTSLWYVMNSETGAWTKFSGSLNSDNLNSCDSVVFNNKLYFIDGSSKVYYYDGSTGTIVNTTFECRQAYTYLGTPDNKLVTIVQPHLNVSGSGTVGVDVDSDFNPTATVSNSVTTSGGATTIKPMFSANKEGTAVAAHFSAHASVSPIVKWYSTKFLWVPGRSI